MYQSFDVKGGPDYARKHLPLIRREMQRLGLDAFFLPHEDEFQNEYLPAANERLAWATGFTGSAGSAFILADRAILFTDGRYTLQAGDQTPDDLVEVRTVPQGNPEAGAFYWLAEQSGLRGKRIGYDPALMSPNDVDALGRAAAGLAAPLVAVADNPVDTAWASRPAQPAAPIHPHPDEFSGESSVSKRTRLAQSLRDAGLAASLITSPASIAWLFNIRGGDVAHSPLPLARALLHADGKAELFVDDAKLDGEVRRHLGPDVAIGTEAGLPARLKALSGKRVGLDPAIASAFFFDLVRASGAEAVRQTDPCLLPRARKNPAEIAGSQSAHIRDGAALSRFLRWMDTEAQSGKVTEIEAVERLEAFRAETNALRDISFETISGAGPNGAIIHYRVSTATNRHLKRGSLFLVDSGGQYQDGTTDVTRTLPVGRPTREMRRAYTLVLKGHIALSVVRFPPGTTGTHLDVLARHALWQAGLDYAHGTGHGVGAYLGVHEGPQRISKALNPWPLEPGMIVSNEPGYYKPGGFGIRIENLQYVTPPAPIPGGEIDMLGFETLTLAPLARGLIVKSMLTREEKAWVDAYHARTAAEIGPRLQGEDRAWLEAACAPL